VPGPPESAPQDLSVLVAVLRETVEAKDAQLAAPGAIPASSPARGPPR
jgi:hypothetical protein